MKRNRSIALFLLALVTVFNVPTSQAVTKPLNQLAVIGDIPSNVGIFIDKTSIYTFGVTESVTSDIAISSFDKSGNLLSRRFIDGGGNEYVIAGASDGRGNYWFLGGDSPASIPTPIDTTTATAVNPDGVVVEAIPSLRSDIQNIVLWRLTLASGEITRFAQNFSYPVLATAISADGKGISVTGMYRGKNGYQNFVITMSSAGKFSTPIPVGGPATTINAIQRAADGSIDLFGASSEVLGGTRLAGKVDGVLIKVRGNKIAQVVRSSAVSATREWVSVGASTFLMGTVKVGKKIEAAATKFASFKPVWTVRNPSTGAVAGFLNSTGAYFAYSTPSGFNFATFSTKGVAGPIYATSVAATPIAMAYSKELGVITLAYLGDRAAFFAPTSG